MTEQVKVDNISDIDTLAGSAQSASNNFRDETESAYQTFQLKTKDQASAALTKFLEELNTLSDQVFSTYPMVLQNFGTTVSDYAGALTDEGFSTIVYTDNGDISNIKTWLTVQRYNSISEKGEALDKAFSKASDVMAEDPVSKDIGDVTTSSIVSNAQETLTDHAKKYQDKHDNLIDAKTTFVPGLDTASGDVAEVKGALTRASNISKADTAYFVKWLADGKLTEANMDVIYLISDTGDDEMLDVLMYEGSGGESFFRRLGKVDATHVSQGMMDMVYGRFYENVYDGEAADVDKLNAFFGSLSKQDQEKVKTYMEKLSTSGVRLAAVTTSGAVAMMPDFGTTQEEHEAYAKKMEELQASGKLAEINQNLQNMGNLNALFESVYIGDIGKGYSQEAYMEYISKVTGLEQNDNGSFSWTRKSYVTGSGAELGAEESFDVSYETSGTIAKGDKAAAELDDLHKQQADSVQDLFKKGAVMVGDKIVPGLGTAIGAVSAIVDNTEDGNLSTYVGSGNDLGASVFGKKYPELLDDAAGGAEAVFDFVENMSDLSQQEQAARADLDNSLFDTGGTYIDSSVTGHDKANYAMAFDLQASLQSYDMEQNGLRTYIYTKYDQAILDTYDEKIAESEGMSKEVSAMLAGESQQSIGGKSGVSEEELWKALKEIQENSTDYGLSDSDFQANYIDDNRQRFDDLVGN
ncbi:hypothetical protein ACVR0S_09115 [Streptococcus dentapri]|uniref:LXG domain-containing protein n=1 Tax=Streptococcus dentapri TaxID=573564 RepID=A0ABV8D022_9STRE